MFVDRREWGTAAGGGVCLAAEEPPGYAAGGPRESPLDSVEAVERGLDALLAGDAAADVEVLADAVKATVRLQGKLAAAQARLVEQFERREGPRADACLTTASWLRFATRLGWGDAQRVSRRTRLLSRMPGLAEALAAGEVSLGHVDVIAARATHPWLRILVEHEQTLVELARRAEPRDVKVAVRKIIEQVARDGADDPPHVKAEDLREVRLRPGFDGLARLEGTVTPLLEELLLRAGDLYGTPDAEDVPVDKRRTPSQRFHDALRDALAAAIEAHSNGKVGGVRTHAVVFADLFTLLGHDQLASIRPKLSRAGVVDPDVARYLLATSNPTLRLVLGLGPWMPVNVSRARRTLPDWLRTALQLVHQQCRGPGCDRPFAWTEADHARPWRSGGETGLTNTDPGCKGHHKLKELDDWDVRFNPYTGYVTWTSADGTRRIDIPPPDP